jgi:predicted sugar kinase
VRGVGQSSWGPTLFALQDSREAAELLKADLTHDLEVPPDDIVITPVQNHGACIEHIKPGTHGGSLNRKT